MSSKKALDLNSLNILAQVSLEQTCIGCSLTKRQYPLVSYSPETILLFLNEEEIDNDCIYGMVFAFGISDEYQGLPVSHQLI